MHRVVVLLMLLCGMGVMPCCAQAPLSLSRLVGATGLEKEATAGIGSVSNKSLSFLHKKYETLNASLEKQSQKMLRRLQKKEEKLARQLRRKDSAKAAQLFDGMDERYASLREKLASPFDTTKAFPLTEYLPGIDSVQTALGFLTKGVNLPEDKVQKAREAAGELKGLQDRLQKASDIEAFVKQRERQLKEQLQHSGLARGLTGINKEAFYYSQRLRECKEVLRSPEKIEAKLLGAVRESKAFRSFMKKNSYLSRLFPTPENYGTAAALAGLQTRASVQGMLQQRFGSGIASAAATTTSPSVTAGGSGGGMGGGSGAGYLQQQMTAAQSQLSALKDKMNKLGISGGSSDMTMPDFTPNSQHTKSFPGRLTYGANVQSEGARQVIPATSDVALTVGYRLNDKSTVGVGASYRVGWGSGGLKNLKVTHEGVGLRSYVDIRAKGSFWLSGGYEMNYMQSFAHYQQLYNIGMWQRSGLIGITKKYKVGKKENNMQLLWDFLSYRQVPRAPAIKFRVGFGF